MFSLEKRNSVDSAGGLGASRDWSGRDQVGGEDGGRE